MKKDDVVSIPNNDVSKIRNAAIPDFCRREKDRLLLHTETGENEEMIESNIEKGERL